MTGLRSFPNWMVLLSTLALATGCRIDRDVSTKKSASQVVGGCFEAKWSVTSSKAVGLRSSTLGGGEIAQSFVLESDLEVSSAELLLSSTHGAATTIPGALTLKLEESTGDPATPSSVTLRSASNVMAASVMTGTPAYHRFTFESPITLRKGTRYWLRLYGAYNPSSTDLVLWQASDSNPDRKGQAMYQGATGWSAEKIGVNRDMAFFLHCID